MVNLLIVLALSGTAYPEADVSQAFREVCLGATSERAITASAIKHGWKLTEPVAGTALSTVVETQKQWAAESGVSSKTSAYTRTVGGTALGLVINYTAPFKGWASRVDCGVFDFAATARLSDAAVARIQSKPADKHHTSANLWFRAWEDFADKASVRIGFVAPGSPFERQIGYAGSSFQASYNSETK